MRKFFIVSTQRSGTTWFAEKLAGMFGRCRISEETDIRWWEELSSNTFIERKKLDSYYLPRPRSFIPLAEKEWAFPVFETNKIIRKTEQLYDDVYNSLNDNEFVNIMYDQCSINSILKYPVIHLIRKDSVAQATSTLIARETGVYHDTEHYYNKINNVNKTLDLNYDLVVKIANRCNQEKEVYYNTLKKYHKNCLTIFYEDCSDVDYWKNTLNKKLENFMQDSIQNADYETENKKTRKLFEITNSDGQGWKRENFGDAIRLCEKNNLSINAESLSKIMYFEGK
jgi:hypothetical protein